MITRQLEEAIQKIPPVEGLGLSVESAEGHDKRVDASVTLTYGGKSRRLNVQARLDLTSTGVNLLVSRLSSEEAAKQLIYAPYINPTCAGRLRQHGVNFLDDEGHVFLRAPGLYLFVSDKAGKGRRGRGAAVVSSFSSPKPFKQVTLKLVYAFLADPDLDAGEQAPSLINVSYREMKNHTGLSLGSISNAVEDLVREEYLIEIEDGKRILVNRKKLFERWVQGYGTRLRPKLVAEHYRPPRQDWWKDADVTVWGGLWGSEIAGAKLTRFLKPETATIYTDTLPHDFIVQHDLRKDPAGPVEVLKPFWSTAQPFRGGDCVHPLVAYADLAASSIDRNLETAERIYEDYLRKIVESD